MINYFCFIKLININMDNQEEKVRLAREKLKAKFGKTSKVGGRRVRGKKKNVKSNSD